MEAPATSLASRVAVPRIPANGNSAFLDEQRVIISGLMSDQTCYNSGMASYRGKTLVALRIDNQNGHGDHLTQHIAMVEMNDQWCSCTPWTWLKAAPGPGVVSTDEDPRLSVVGDALYIIYNMAHEASRRMHVGRIDVGTDSKGATTFQLYDDKKLDFTEGPPNGWEKNWVPFAYNNTLHLAYTINPPVVLRLTPAQLSSPQSSIVPEVVSRSTSLMRWNFGVMRGGSQALFDPTLQKYVAIFHSSVSASGRQGLMRYYVMGFYTFEPHPPFAIDRMVCAPLVGAGFYDRATDNVSIIFPQGIIDANQHWRVMYGKDDKTLHVATLDKKRLTAQLTTPTPILNALGMELVR